MKKVLGALLSGLMLLSFFGVFAEDSGEEQPPVSYIAGLVSQIQDDGSILLAQFDGVEVLVRLTEDTRIAVSGQLAIGRAVVVACDGAMTRSLPPQVTAISVSSDTIEGAVHSVDQKNNRLLIISAEYQEVSATLEDAESAAAYADQYVQVLFGGFLTLSLPPQAHAIGIRPLSAERGVILERSDDWFLLVANGDVLHVSLTDATKAPKDLAEGETVLVMFSAPVGDPLAQSIEAISVERAGEAE